MWMIDPKKLCNKHLIGEHGELHKFLPSFRKGFRVDKRFIPVVQIQLNAILERHDILAKEMIERGMSHKSPLLNIPDLKKTYPKYFDLNVDLDISNNDLCDRCIECKRRIEQFKYILQEGLDENNCCKP